MFVRPDFAEGVPTFWWRAGLAMIGALGVIAVLGLLGGIGSSGRIVLTGFALSLMLQAITSYLLLKAQMLRAAEAQTWLAGSTSFVRMDAIAPLVLGLAPFVVLGAWCARDLPFLAHDDASAVALGVSVPAARALLLLCATGITAVVVSLVGPIGFVELIAPHMGAWPPVRRARPRWSRRRRVPLCSPPARSAQGGCLSTPRWVRSRRLSAVSLLSCWCGVNQEESNEWEIAGAAAAGPGHQGGLQRRRCAARRYASGTPG